MTTKSKPALVVMAAGLGSRYGGLKQMDPVGPGGEWLMDYAIYDALKAGFGRVVFVVSDIIAKNFRETVGNRVERVAPVSYAYQHLDDLPGGMRPPGGRVKPWGTGHAVFACRYLLDAPFAVINADDYYGLDAFVRTVGFLNKVKSDGIIHCCMTAYRLGNTMTEHGYVARGVCRLTGDGYLSGITERTHITYLDGAVGYTEDDAAFVTLPPDTPVSMNMWGFPYEIHNALEPLFKGFLDQKNADMLNAEFFLPAAVNWLLETGQADVRVLNSDAKWYGVTYREDRMVVKEAILDMIKAGQYPERLWGVG